MPSRSVLVRLASTLLLAAAAHSAISAPAAPAATGNTGSGNTAAAAAITALVADDTEAAQAAFPTDFAAVMGYSPIVERGLDSVARLVDPEGDCSAPIPLPEVFESACRVHDLGYDLLRYARATEGELGPDARRRLDSLFARHLDLACRSDPQIALCHPISKIASAAVEFNSWRQGRHSPVPESPLPLVLGAGSALLGLASRRALDPKAALS
ncbi:hypothetical protein OED52_13185 [Rhodococcus sp. Z13]|uniref:Uncharacterized protein n=1 Tax=Rhodococcus sacchari TaxID=2962047 RepID=A0ACD4DC77_9NOCA|nr:hypothetical protein [Rhodococcus sp. Z13]UYP17634.1 hypothetical protein OED52_13185 [Rhodococcus sp. Z13]